MDRMETKEDYTRKVEGRLGEWNARLEELKAKAAKSTADLKVKYHEEINVLKARRDELEARLHDLQQAGEDAWHNVRDRAEQAWQELQASLERITSKPK